MTIFEESTPVVAARRLRPIAAVTAGVCISAASLVAVVDLTGTVDPVRMPVAPHWVTVGAALVATGLVSSGRIVPPRPRHLATAACVLGLAAGCVAAVPHTVLTLLVWALAQVTGGSGSFDVTPAWLPTGATLLTVAATAALTTWLVADRRRASGHCAACGRTDPRPPAREWRSLPVWAVVAAVSALPYGLLKLLWSLGVPVGLTGHAFDDVGFTSPGFGDTVVLTGIGLAIAVAMGCRVTAGGMRRILIGVGGLGSLMLLPVGATAGVRLIGVLAGHGSIDGTEIAPWAFVTVYTSFAAWGAALLVLTVGYAVSTRHTCRRHRLASKIGTSSTERPLSSIA